MEEEYLSLVIRGPAATETARKMFACCPCPARKTLSITFSNLPEGTKITMSTASATLSVEVNQKALGHIAYTDGTLPTSVTFVSDNPSILVTQNDAASFYVGGDNTNAVTGNVTFTDQDGNTLVVAVTTGPVVTPPAKTLGITFDAPVAN